MGKNSLIHVALLALASMAPWSSVRLVAHQNTFHRVETYSENVRLISIKLVSAGVTDPSFFTQTKVKGNNFVVDYI